MEVLEEELKVAQWVESLSFRYEDSPDPRSPRAPVVRWSWEQENPVHGQHTQWQMRVTKKTAPLSDKMQGED